MKPRDFYKIMEQFVYEDKYWRALKVGDVVYTNAYSIEASDFQKMRIDAVNIDEREITTRNISEVGIAFSVVLADFFTEEEYNHLHPITS